MEERQVTVDGDDLRAGHARSWSIATQNPIEMEGTYPLPEAQRDRFMARVSMGYPDQRAELAMLDIHGGASPLDDLQPVADATEVARLIDAVRGVHVADRASGGTPSTWSNATRNSPDLRLGASPRATLQLLRAARACGRAGRPRLRAARRRPGARRARCWRTGCCPPPRRRSRDAATGDDRRRPRRASVAVPGRRGSLSRPCARRCQG